MIVLITSVRCITCIDGQLDPREQCLAEAEHRGVAGPQLQDGITEP